MSKPSNEQRHLCNYATEIDPEMELRVDGESRNLVGYAAVFGKESVDLGGFVEVIQRGAFADALKAGVDIRALVDHDFKQIIGRVSAGNLKLEENRIGLKVTITDLPDTSYANDLLMNVRSKLVRGMSFGFRVAKDGDKFTYLPDGKVLRTISKIANLSEVTATSIPAYEATSLEARVDPSVLQRATEMAQHFPRLKMAERHLKLHELA